MEVKHHESKVERSKAALAASKLRVQNQTKECN